MCDKWFSIIKMSGVVPKFMTAKYSITKIDTLFNVFDYELRYHALNRKNLYLIDKCSHNLHKHNNNFCYLTTENLCPVCKVPNRLIINYENLLCHSAELLNAKELYRLTCCTHIHTRPCRVCLLCNTIPTPNQQEDGEENEKTVEEDGGRNQGSLCVLGGFSVECNLTTAAICPVHKKFNNNYDAHLSPSRKIFIKEHIYDINNVIFWVCETHTHRHHEQPNKLCWLQSYKCCDSAVKIQKYPSSFMINVFSEHLGKNVSYTIYDTRIWREQSRNHFNSFVKAVIAKPSVVHTRYERFEKLSNFTISEVKKYISGKESAARTIITGFETRGLYQTATISCSLKHYEIMIPQKLWDNMLLGHFDTSYFIIKRDPSFKSTCLYVVYGHRNPDPHSNTIIISDFLSKPLHQDVDGDKNCIYLFPLLSKLGYNTENSYGLTLAKIEMGNALGKMLTLIATPRYQLSETNILLLYKYREWLKAGMPKHRVFSNSVRVPRFIERTSDRTIE
uniref:FtsK_0 protein n=1 Tax=Fopius arisanus TaxID=64838 RepID=A0A0C9RKE6_9HYME